MKQIDLTKRDNCRYRTVMDIVFDITDDWLLDSRDLCNHLIRIDRLYQTYKRIDETVR